MHPNYLFRLVFSSNKEDVLGRHDGPVRCIEYSYAAGTFIPILNCFWISVIAFTFLLQGTCAA
jgi:hypothetical protein